MSNDPYPIRIHSPGDNIWIDNWEMSDGTIRTLNAREARIMMQKAKKKEMEQLTNLPVGHIDFNPNMPPDPPEINQARTFALQEYIKHLRQEDLVTALCQCVASIDDEHLVQALEQMSDKNLNQVLISVQKETFARDDRYAEDFQRLKEAEKEI